MDTDFLLASFAWTVLLAWFVLGSSTEIELSPTFIGSKKSTQSFYRPLKHVF